MIRVTLATAVLLGLGSIGVGQPGGEKPGRVDALGDALPLGAITRLGSARLCNQGQVAAIAFSPDGKWVASGYGTVRLFDAANGKEVRVFKPPVPGGGPFAFSPDGKLLATSTGGKLVCLWEPDTGKLVKRLEGQGDIRSIVFAPNSQLLAVGSGNGAIFLWEIPAGKQLHTLKGHRDAPEGLVFSHDNKTLVSTGHDGTTRYWNVAAGNETAKIAPSQLATSRVAFTKDGKTLIVTGGANSAGQISYYNADNRQLVRQFSAHKGGVLGMALSKDGKTMMTGGYDRVVRFWDVETATEVAQLSSQSGDVNNVALSPDGETVAWGTYYGSRIYLAKITGRPFTFELKELIPRTGHESAVAFIEYSPDGKKILSTSNDEYAIVWDEATGKELHRFQKGYRGAWSRDSKLIALADVNDGSKKLIYLFEADTGKEVQRVTCPAQIYSIAFSADRRTLMVGASDSAVYLIELDTGKIRARISGKVNNLWRAVVAPDGYTVAVASEDAVVIFDAIAGKELGKVPLKIGSGALAFSPDGKLLACGMYTGGTVLWDLEKGKEARRIPGRAMCLAFTPDGQSLAATGLDGSVRVFEVATAKELHKFAGHTGWAIGVAVSPDGRTLLSGSTDSTILMWPIDPFRKGKPIRAALSAAELKKRLGDIPVGKPEEWFADLAGPDAEKAYRAVWGLVAQPRESMAMLELTVSGVSTAPIAKLIADLDHAEFVRREDANRKLEVLGRLAEPALREALMGKLSAESRRRIERLLAARESGFGGMDEGLRLLRTIEVLERIGTDEARALLTSLAKQAVAREAAQRADAALQRLKGK